MGWDKGGEKGYGAKEVRKGRGKKMGDRGWARAGGKADQASRRKN